MGVTAETVGDWIRLGRVHSICTPRNGFEICEASLAALRGVTIGCAPRPHDPRVGLLLASVEQRYDSPALSLSGLAKELNLSSWYLGRLFKGSVGLGFRRHLRNVRIAKGEQLLTTTFLSVKEVAARVGYRHVSDFVHHFKEQYGTPPARHRAQKGLLPTSPALRSSRKSQ